MAIWSKGDDATNDLVHAFTVGDDYLYDRHLAPFDLLGCIAHAAMLARTGIIAQDDGVTLIRALRQLDSDYQAGAWTVEVSDEDVHSKIEALLTERIGEPAKRLHTGRSRNDQVLTAIRLWQKHALQRVCIRCCETARELLAQAQTHEFHPFPGYTHLQRGMPSSLGMYFGSFAQALLDNIGLIHAAYDLADRCPLGSGASYGTGLPLDRRWTSAALGFGRAPGLAMADANGRGKVETATLDSLGAVVGDLSRLAGDMVFFTSAECRFFAIGQGFTTGSSIMPQKKNLDLFELLRGRAARFLGLRTGLAATTIGLSSGYSRDLQDTKAMLLDGMRLAEEGLAVVHAAVPTLEPQREQILAALTPDLYATDEAYRLVREEGMAFRDAYVKVGRTIDQLATPDHDATVRNRDHIGSTGNLGLAAIGDAIERQRADWAERQRLLQDQWQELLAADPTMLTDERSS